MAKPTPSTESQYDPKMTATSMAEEQPRRRSTGLAKWFTILEALTWSQGRTIVEETRHLLLPRIG